MDTNEFRKRMKALPEPPSDSHPPLWQYWQRNLWECVVKGQHPERIFEFPCVYHCMLVNHWPGATDKEFNVLLNADSRYLEACLMPDFGEPKDWYANRYSAALIHQAHHLFRYLEWSGEDIRDYHDIFEFGGGYGAMALVCRRMGFDGMYTIYDLPEFSLLQEYYLSNTVGTDRVRLINESMGVFAGYQDLFVACFSLSEIDYEMREMMVSLFPSSGYLTLYSGRFVDYDNIDYFTNQLPALRPGITWETRPADHLPDDNRYCFGKLNMGDISSAYFLGGSCVTFPEKRFYHIIPKDEE